ncbi:hypothetical protein E2C01_006130 [Portunus trituberculatus]|uniref:Uncharacterized protein n=1 Tax=Portunus trituberculatus TaxID=210409 RepID=A0A5B7CUC1_PORTR|nr:hypothetical protein [Portunus trituberculatus]
MRELARRLINIMASRARSGCPNPVPLTAHHPSPATLLYHITTLDHRLHHHHHNHHHYHAPAANHESQHICLSAFLLPLSWYYNCAAKTCDIHG